MKIKFEKKEKQSKQKKTKVMKVGIRKKSTIFLWGLLVASVSFGIYKNFTAINIHTINEREVVEMKMVDTTKIQSFVENFAKAYYSWEQDQKALDSRNEQLKNYLTEELQHLNNEVIRADIPTSSNVKDIQFWSIEQGNENEYEVLFSVDQIIKESETTKTVISTYLLTVYIDENQNMVIIKNPSISSKPSKANYEPKILETDGTVDAETTDNINEFLETFFKLYPTASEKELSYYVSNGVLKPINKDYVYAELINPVYIQNDNQVMVSVAVKYLDQQTKATQISQFNITLQKSDNWIIVR